MSPSVDTNTRILDAALQLFYEQGYKGTTTRAIAEQAGVNEVTVFRNLGSKRGIFIAVIKREADVRDELEGFDLEPTGDLVEDLTRTGMRITHEMVSRAKLVKIIMVEAATDPEVWESIHETPFAILARITGYFEEAKERGFLRKEVDPRIAAIGFFSFFFRTLIANAFLGRDVFIEMDEDTIRHFVDMYVNGISN
jgi:AcrR family transcriptional regulator